MAHTQKAVKSGGVSQLGHYQLRSAEKAAEVRPLLVFSLRLRLQQWSPRRAGESENPHDDFPLTCNWQKRDTNGPRKAVVDAAGVDLQLLEFPSTVDLSCISPGHYNHWLGDDIALTVDLSDLTAVKCNID